MLYSQWEIQSAKTIYFARFSEYQGEAHWAPHLRRSFAFTTRKRFFRISKKDRSCCIRGIRFMDDLLAIGIFDHTCVQSNKKIKQYLTEMKTCYGPNGLPIGTPRTGEIYIVSRLLWISHWEYSIFQVHFYDVSDLVEWYGYWRCCICCSSTSDSLFPSTSYC